MNGYDTSITDTAARTALRMRRTLRAEWIGEDVGDGMRALFDRARDAGLQPVGPPAITYLGELGRAGRIDAVFTLPVQQDSAENLPDDAQLAHEEATTVARTTHHGPYHELGAAHQALADSLPGLGCHAVGPPTEVYLVGPDQVFDQSDLVTEIRVPVAQNR